MKTLIILLALAVAITASIALRVCDKANEHVFVGGTGAQSVAKMRGSANVVELFPERHGRDLFDMVSQQSMEYATTTEIAGLNARLAGYSLFGNAAFLFALLIVVVRKWRMYATGECARTNVDTRAPG